MVKVAFIKRRFVKVNEAGRRVGDTHHRAKLSEDDLRDIFELRDAGFSLQQIADKMDHIPGGIGKSTVKDVLDGRTRSQVIWKIVKR